MGSQRSQSQNSSEKGEEEKKKLAASSSTRAAGRAGPGATERKKEVASAPVPSYALATQFKGPRGGTRGPSLPGRFAGTLGRDIDTGAGPGSGRVRVRSGLESGLGGRRRCWRLLPLLLWLLFLFSFSLARSHALAVRELGGLHRWAIAGRAGKGQGWVTPKCILWSCLCRKRAIFRSLPKEKGLMPI